MNQAEAPKSRVYTHHRCTSETVVGDESFEALSDPLSGIERTWCETCMDYFPLSEFKWSDTDEKISDYYARHTANASGGQRFLTSRMFLLITVAIGFLLGAAGGFAITRDDNWLAMLIVTFGLGMVGMIILGSIKEFLLGPIIIRQVTGVRDTRLLK